MNKNTKHFVKLGVLILFLIHSLPKYLNCQQKGFAPPNQPAIITISDSGITIKYSDKIILKAQIENNDESTDFVQLTDRQDNTINQVFKWTSRTKPLTISGKIFASEEAFPCESDRKRTGPDIVRHSVGLSSSSLNRAVYDRKYDCVLSVDFPADVLITPDEILEHTNEFNIKITGRTIMLRFRPYFFQKHRELAHFRPWEYQVWKQPVVGWCSWFAYFQGSVVRVAVTG